MDFSTLEVGDEVEREGEDDIRFRAIVENMRSRGGEISLGLRITELLSPTAVMSTHGIWATQSCYQDKYKLVNKISQRGQVKAETRAEPEPHIAGLSPERIDWSAHRAFLRECN